ncbi:rab GTPase binding protein upregulated in meiosis II [Schizosaccharomyces cryophilus OY26]|uniref:PRA1 family protein n=1 Tax=Schizosaccharomyces cryophilus (strain OY26 / ATCC MYA-4695 / CBS 11777 / NBRC 106824 / NRRL Y48691) TaxID=653667 RepID=S9X4P3_SCHCR|nr:rab GTPase binding protein upregulated in meiosis II [Schizosaccharomyces cryophilus OY26]EPY52047.1 rab GTPase binding protein upregulated in meiosis II [Schizosaccharomyces cryophilus OY26]
MDFRYRMRKAFDQLGPDSISTSKRVISTASHDEYWRMGKVSVPRLDAVHPRMQRNFKKNAFYYAAFFCAAWIYIFIWYPSSLLVMTIGVFLSFIAYSFGDISINESIQVKPRYTVSAISSLTIVAVLFLVPFSSLLWPLCLVSGVLLTHALLTSHENPAGLL